MIVADSQSRDLKLDDPKLHDEAGRLAALHRYEVLDTPSEGQFDRITALVRTVMNVPMAAVSLIDSDRQWMKSCPGMPAQQTSRDISFCTHTIQKRDPLVVCDALMDDRFADNEGVLGSPYIRAYVGVPLATPDGYNIGSLCAIDTMPREFSPEQIAVLQSFAAIVVDELELLRIAQTDFLTGAVTRRGFVLEMEKAMARNRRGGHAMSLLMLDIDHFKHVNDTYGHPAGDQVLKMVSNTIGNHLRRGDTLGRLGGEEFGVLLQDMDLDSAQQTAERLRAEVEAAVTSHDPEIRVTASFGICALESGIRSTEEWLATVDAALYEAKHAGRNRCCIAQAIAAS